MSLIAFEKLSATGNDFVLIDNRKRIIDPTNTDLIKAICTRRNGIGADGALLIEDSEEHDFKMRYYNADGFAAEMCGNGARAAAFSAFHDGLCAENLSFEVSGVPYSANVKDDFVNLSMHMPEQVQLDLNIVEEPYLTTLGFAVVGVPHLVIEAENVETLDVEQMGKKYCHHPYFSKTKTNVNFVSNIYGKPRIRTYERGVFAETLSCGTGNVATAFLLNKRYNVTFPVHMQTNGGELIVDYNQGPLLGGWVKKVYSGTFESDQIRRYI